VSRSRGAFTILELIAALAVVAVVSALAAQVMWTSRRAAAHTGEMRLATAAAQGAYERLRIGEFEALRALDATDVEACEEASLLSDLRVTATAAPWREEDGLLHLRVALRWRSRDGTEREVMREGLIGANTLR
jgi:prepilin-type N-terminal cleavage/methylation domain-containing protein